MEFYDTLSNDYISLLKSNKHKRYRIKIELLSYNETVIGEITKDLSVSAQGQITVNYQQITRRSCSLTLMNVENKYIPSSNNLIWYNRKFKIWVGVADHTDNIYWWSYGVYITQSATSDKHTVQIEGIDKGGVLDGSVKTGMIGEQYIVRSGVSLGNMIKDTLMIDLSTLAAYDRTTYTTNNMPLDPIEPIIDSQYYNMELQSDISVDTNNYISSLFTTISDSYGADVYYNTHGHLVLSRMIGANKSDEYRFMGHQWEYSDISSMYSENNIEYDFNGYNCVTVYTNATNSNIENVSYTAVNNNPSSPVRVNAIGLRRMESQEIPYVDVSGLEMELRCKAYADYLLTKESMLGMNVTFQSVIIPHLDVNKTIGLTDSVYGFENETFVVQSIVMPLSSGIMSVTATNISWLPNDTNLEGMGA
jgi:hypothetical protein